MSNISNGRSTTVADHPFLAFLNTVSDDGKTRHENTFANAAELCAELAKAGVPVPPDAARQVDMSTLMSFREAAYGTLSAYAAGRAPAREDMLVVESSLKRALANGDFRLVNEGFKVQAHALGGLIDELALQYLDLANQQDFERLKECQRCTKMFLDHGRGRGRRWCDMSTCGNRAKAESFRARKRAVASKQQQAAAE